METNTINEEYVNGYKKYDEVCAILINGITQAKMIDGVVVGDVSYRYDYPTLAIHTNDMEDKDDWIEIDTDLIAHTKDDALTKLRKFIDSLESIYKAEKRMCEVNK